MDHKKAQVTALATIASAILSGLGFIAMAIRPNDEGYLIAIIGGGLPFLIFMRALYSYVFSKKAD